MTTQTDNQAQDYRLLKNRFRGYLPVVIDVETAGLNAQTDALLEIAAITLKMDEQGYLQLDEKFHCHIQPFEGANINPESLKVNGIDIDNPERGAIPEVIAIPEMFKMIRKAVKDNGCQRAVIVAHNATFDQAFLQAAVKRINAKRDPFHPFAMFDTATLAGFMYGQTVLVKACQMAQIPFDGKQAHSALYDTERTAELFCTMVNKLKDLGGFPPVDNS
ncbi:ribonuclease T [Ursidibacter maritimus]|uniref:Ribonuclease T n=1 Tax=Ursidibacter maritimus TaxID=1331689 RepID=A0A949WEB0_9PAST|nr:ribonuclease T [Ursidibacter maritimus]KAE9540519.1 ribonuclease T [Ursidibacter maritimus]MBV6523610.1 ribonuclease T [Ursidibacter maritimus]MBV6525110.1 ribonuclease T [Ursidibacter maritimus]MBV6527312.1 ribonuclease T [Ursidibacter maritimus]MBV6528724.1 ribonuclease T [Ursidibacter maritimus]